MKIAMPVKDGMVNQHFGKSPDFALFEVEGGQIKGVKELNSLDLHHKHEELGDLLQQHGVDTVIAGGLGLGAFIALKSRGMEVISGVAGESRQVVEDYIAGNLEVAPTVGCDCNSQEESSCSAEQCSSAGCNCGCGKN